MATNIDLGGNSLICESVKVGATGPGQTGTDISGTELGFIDGVTAGTAAASKALVLNSSSGITTGLTLLTATTLTATTVNAADIVAPANATYNATSTGTIGIGSVSTGRVTITPVSTHTGLATFTGGIIHGAAARTTSNASSVTCSSNAATTTTQYTKITSESLSTAHTASQALVITLTGMTTAGFAVATIIGGTNTGGVPVLKTACTTDTVTITIQNNAIATNAFNGTFIIWLQTFVA